MGTGYASHLLPGVVCFGTGLSLTVAPLTSAALSSVEDEFTGVAAGVNNAVARSAQLLAVPLLPLAAGISGIETVGGLAFSEGFQRAQLVNALILVGSGVAGWLILRSGPTHSS